MKKHILREAEAYAARRRSRRRWRMMIGSLACLVLICTVYGLILPAAAQEGEPKCGLTEHTHSVECYTQVTEEISADLSACPYADPANSQLGFVVHQHSEVCYGADGELICPLPEIKPHEHTEECYTQHVHGDECYDQQQGEQICGKTEGEGAHTHDDTCYDADGNCTCGQEESTGHQHSNECYEWTETLICTQSTDPVLTCTLTDQNVVYDGETYTLHQHSDECGAECQLPELIEHDHGPECWATVTVPADTASLTCGLDESEEHSHSELCYGAWELICTQTEHTHTEECYAAQEDAAQPTPEPENNDDIATLDQTADNDVGSNDFGSYITGATVQKLNGDTNTWEDATEFKEGDQVRVSLKFDVPSDVITNNNNSMTYQLPSAIKPNREFTGDVLRNGSKVGSYHIDTKGLITITYTDAFATGDAFYGDIFFQGTLELEGNEDKVEVNFGGDSGSITITKEEESQEGSKDLSIEKTSNEAVKDDQTGNYKITYTVTASTVQGSPDGKTIEIGDHMDLVGCTSQYKTINVVRVSANGTETPLTEGKDYQVEKYWGIKLKGLPALEAGESYKVTYDVEVIPSSDTDGLMTVENNAWTYVPGLPNSNDSDYKILQQTLIKKNGQYDPGTDLIYWTIEVTAGDTATPLHDVISTAGNAQYNTQPVIVDGVDGITITMNGNEYDPGDSLTISGNKMGFDWIVPASTDPENPDKYVITYATVAPKPNNENDSYFHVINEVDYGGHKGKGEVYGNHPVWEMSKHWTGEQAEDAEDLKYIYKWNFSVSVPPSEAMDQIVYTDNILDPNVAGVKHYAIASELDAALKQNLHLQARASLGSTDRVHYYTSMADAPVDFEIEYYTGTDCTGDLVKPDDTTTEVKSFRVTVKAKAGQDVYAEYLNMGNGSYPTHVDASALDEGETVTIVNRGNAFDITRDASHDITRKYTISKFSAAPNGGDITTGTYGNGITVSYDQENGQIWYRVLYRTTSGQNETLTLTDVMSPGLSYVNDSLRGTFYEHDANQPGSWTQWYGGKSVTYDLTDRMSASFSGNTLQITIPAGYNGLDEGGNAKEVGDRGPYTLAIYYAASYANDPDLAGASTQKTYSNTVSVSDSTAYTETTVDKTEKEILQKSMEQILDENGYNTNQVRYRVIINPEGLDLESSLDSLDLTDTLTLPEGVEATLDLKNTALYAYDSSNEEGGYKGDPIDKTLYTVKYDQDTHTLALRLPDSLACVLEYIYTVDLGNKNTAEIKNKVDLSGRWSETTPGQVGGSESGSNAGRHGSITFFKVDADNYNTKLAGAEFSISKWVPNEDDYKQNGHWEDHLINGSNILTTNEDGEIVLSGGSEAGGALEPLTLYCLEETTAPEGYPDVDPKDPIRYYFVLLGDKTWETENKIEGYDTSTQLDAYKYMHGVGKLPKAGSLDGFDEGNIKWFDNSVAHFVYIENARNQLTVNKLWQDAAGDTIQAPQSVTLDIYRATLAQDGCLVNFYSRDLSGNNYGDGSNRSISQVLKRNSTVTVVVEKTYTGSYSLQIGDGTLSPINGADVDNGYKFTFMVPDADRVDVYLKTSYDGWCPPILEFNGTTAEHVFVPDKAPEYTITLGASEESVSDDKKTISTTGWSYTINNVPSLDEGVYWFVREQENGNWTPTYLNNGIQTGTITVLNSIPEQEGFTLPETGGDGTYADILGGLLLSSATLLLWWSKRREGKRAAAKH